jgi:hypothetical protein
MAMNVLFGGWQQQRRAVLALDDVCFLAIFQVYVILGTIPVVAFNLEYLFLLALRLFRLAYISGSFVFSLRHPRLCIFFSTLGMPMWSFCAFIYKHDLYESRILLIWSLLSCAATILFLGLEGEPAAHEAKPESNAAQVALKKLTLPCTDFPVDAGCVCLICLEDFSASDKAYLQLKCMHLYHKECMETWLASGGPGCPLRCTVSDDVESV